ncbi:MAG: pyridoxal-phosphate dependent enzyme [Propionibacteriaceae bacterium]|jgi:cysteine synthase/rhodanese-related sulfurtransferase|nr:pyridoxal-phosphate dependent enzyme [Propionibacteriaceae bacterium]
MSDNAKRTYESVLDLLPSELNPTPLVRLSHFFKTAKVYAKLEWLGPFGSVKDRVAANLVRDARERGVPIQNLVEPTSGNTGIGLALVSNALGYHFAATLSKAIPAEKRAALRLFGTELYELSDDLCPMPGAPEGAMSKAEELAERPGWTELNQYKNPANPEAHYRTTGPEVWRQTDGQITHFVASLGTCGTITGTGRYLKERNPEVKVIGVHPPTGHDIPGVRALRALALTDFFKPEEYDAVVEIPDEDSYATCHRLHIEESIIAGPSSGLALAGALREIPDEEGVVAVVVFPDNAFKYVSAFRRHLSQLFPPEDAPAPANPFAAHLEAAYRHAEHGPDVVTVAAAAQALDSGVPLVDVRNPEELAAAAIPGAVNVPLSKLSAGKTKGLPKDKEAEVLLICAAGVRSLYALLELKAMGYKNAKSVAGGVAAWSAAGLPLK